MNFIYASTAKFSFASFLKSSINFFVIENVGFQFQHNAYESLLDYIN